MSKYGWTIWIIPFAVWGFYSCWHCGYQSGYAEGHETAWKMYQPNIPASHLAVVTESNDTIEPEITR